MTGSICARCVHFDRATRDREVCKAFPGGIPDAIVFGGSHREPVEGDGGVVFKPKPGFENLEVEHER